jgi:hypothetical protein
VLLSLSSSLALRAGNSLRQQNRTTRTDEHCRYHVILSFFLSPSVPLSLSPSRSPPLISSLLPLRPSLFSSVLGQLVSDDEQLEAMRQQHGADVDQYSRRSAV